MNKQILHIPVDKDYLLKKRVAVYARVSTLKNEQESSYDLQVRELVKSVKSNPMNNLVCVFADKESGKSDNRPAFQKMVELVREGALDLVVTKSIARFSRNFLLTNSYIREFKSFGCEICFDKDGLSTFDDDAEFKLNLLASIAQEESSQVSENTIWSFSKKMSRGINVTNRIYGYSIKRNEYTIIPKQAEVIRMIFSWYIHKVKYREMIDKLHQMKIPSPTGKEYWPQCTLEEIISNEKYVGDMFLRKTLHGKHMKKSDFALAKEKQYYVPNHHKGIVSRSDFDFAQYQRRLRTTYNHDSKALPDNPYNKYFFSKITGRYYSYIVERPKGKYEIPTLKSVTGGIRDSIRVSIVRAGILMAIDHIRKHNDDFLSLGLIDLPVGVSSLAGKLDAQYLGIDDLEVDEQIERYKTIADDLILLARSSKGNKYLKGVISRINHLDESDNIEEIKRIFPSVIIDGTNIDLCISVDQKIYKEIPKHAKKMITLEMPVIYHYRKETLKTSIFIG